MSESFTELALISKDSPQWSKPLKYEIKLSHQEPLSKFLHRFLEHEPPIERVIIGCRKLKRLLETKLGGSVGQVVPVGFENWMRLRQPLLTDRLDLAARRTESLANPELIVSLPLRWDAEGEMIQEPSTEELEAAVQKFKASNVEKVCLHFLHPHKNEERQKKLVRYFADQGFKVFHRLGRMEGPDEIPRWRATVLDACLVSGMEELKEPIAAALNEFGLSNEKIFWASENLVPFAEMIPLEGLFIVNQQLGKRNLDGTGMVLLDRERWRLVYDSREPYHFWKSPWGFIEVRGPSFGITDLQPTCEIIPHDFKSFDFSKNEFGFEPGPMVLGRSVRPLLMDVILFKHPSLLNDVSESGKDKFQNLLKTFAKVTLQMQNWTPEQVNDFIYKRAIEKLALEIRFKSASKKLVLTGALAEKLLPDLREALHGFELNLDPHFGYCNVNAVGVVA